MKHTAYVLALMGAAAAHDGSRVLEVVCLSLSVILWLIANRVFDGESQR